ncbi:1,2-dihydroxy-3-keto-5-methylthiopentene dioxygenase [Entomophthora muscae]|uniref:1,2-dihydroxy-3-keto-5-methylthiopentene dioxygenase n=1 Tax=Entomophthora muscae TaxID=34485 RepID=A0ACC2T3D9_9FUNG|nr:1,2-dihydroxy-3-keto-5-methylthiopentene dioxygenase [Entomophthora muscae]
MHAYYYPQEPAVQGEAPTRSTVTTDGLLKLGVEYYRLEEGQDVDSQIDTFSSERGYSNRDVVNISPQSFGESYAEKLAIFFQEHIHEDEEIRLILEGSGFFDVRDKKDQWIRIALEPLDLIVLPAGIYHRFAPDEKNFTKAMRLFKDLPKWTPINRPAEGNTFREQYVQSLASV